MAGAVESILRKDRAIVVGGLTLVVVLAWAYTLGGAGLGMSAFEMTTLSLEAGDTSMTHSAPADPPISMAGMMMQATWTLGYASLMLLMWWVMMIAMMLPSASPTILLAAAINRKFAVDRRPYGTSGMFALGYLLAWAGFSLIAVLVQWGLDEAGLLSFMMQANSRYLAGGLLVVAGLWQFSPIKQVCLKHCRSPVHFLIRHRRPGEIGALVMGLHHGTFCLGCCWFLMLLLFVGGIMNLYWIAGLALYVLAEKLLRVGRTVSFVWGAILVAWGLGFMFGLV